MVIHDELVTYIQCDSLPNQTGIIDIGAVSGISEPYDTRMSSSPIMGLPSERKILMDLSVSGSKTLTYKRKSPENPKDDYTVDSTNWSNGFWLFNVQRYLVNRFQMDTDGCRLVFRLLDENGGPSELYPAINGRNCYISSFGMGYSAGNPFEISGEITVKLGSCKGSKEGIYVITYHSNFESVMQGLTEATYCQVYYTDTPDVDEYPISWEQYLKKQAGTLSSKSGWWWCPHTVISFDAAFNTEDEGKKNRAYRWEDSSWSDLPDYVRSVKGGVSDLHLYARYSGFHKKW